MLPELPVSPESRSVDGLMAELLPSARKLLGMEVAFVSEFSEGRRVFRYVDSQEGFAPIAVSNSDPLEGSYCQRVIDGRLPELIQDACQNPEAMKMAVTRALPIGAHLSVPIRFRSGRVFGTFCCFSRKPDPTLGRRDLATMRFFAEVVGKVLDERATAEDAKRVSAAQITEVIDKRLHTTAFQPILDLSAHTIFGFEALARFPGEPYRPPNEWLDQAASVGLLEELEHSLLRDALERLNDLPSGVSLSLNVTPTTVVGKHLANTLRAYPLDRLILEITEHESVRDYDAIASALAPWRAQGLRLAIDDVGAGYANFRHILKLRPDIIKLDRSLIHNIDSDADCASLATALIHFSKQFGCQVVAEGVETPEELAALKALGVPLAQGYLLGRPQPLPARDHGDALERID